jgi:hypothetical protein
MERTTVVEHKIILRHVMPPPARSPTILGKEILISGCSDSAKFAFITRQNLLTPPIQRGLASKEV